MALKVFGARALLLVAPCFSSCVSLSFLGGFPVLGGFWALVGAVGPTGLCSVLISGKTWGRRSTKQSRVL